MLIETIPQLRSLSLAKKRRLLAEMIDEIYGAVVTDKKLGHALAARLEHHRHDPASATSWPAAKARLRRKL